jgi:putative transposase
MTATIDDVAKKKPELSAEQEAVAELVRMAKEKGLSLTGPDGLLKQLTKSVIETALGEEMTDHLGYEKHDPAGIGAANIRNGTRSKTVITDASGPVEIEVPRDRAGTFEPQIVKEAPAPSGRGGRGRPVALRQRPDDGRDLRSLLGDLRGVGEQRDDQPDH